ncbi:aromatic ring-hydroxylating oxygenase subunit alpha [Goekera deserti]|uniref:Aromatic ring-hydroxylating dioxygenase subunit alpha n=1 Tax=Goekera deserti TaxID=2497753 RepID=A0A7K3WGD6_9ACTN|nr:aromatic ring-hydroxylating dioxygenase subunit alpha [Goekera deserti]NDI47158.1 Rieske 2Fe-2S domain-containing protein [Goekera deserti]NEL55442.1 aromatic ring-hydroxylating dioxygenase subunit alpha [Goekera deserti]
MVFVPTRGDLPPRHGPDVPLLPAGAEPATVPASVYRDPERYERERTDVLARTWQIVCRSSQIPAAGDHQVWEGQGETIVVTRRRDGGVTGFHNVCQHRGARIVKESGCGARRFRCRWHNWTYDLEGAVLGVPDREDFAPEQLDGLAAPPVECAEWGGWVWVVLAGPGVAPPLTEWLGPELTGDLGAYRMEDMLLIDKLEFDLPVNWKVVIDGFNENYHAPALHRVPAQDVKDGRESTFFHWGPHGMMVVPYKGVLPRLKESRDHQGLAICHYTVFPTAVFNNNPNHLQLFRAVPLAVDRTRFETWELQYDPQGDEDYTAEVDAHWERLKQVVAEDVEIYGEVAATRTSSAYTRNVLNDHECKITHFHRTVQRMLDAGEARREQ